MQMVIGGFEQHRSEFITEADVPELASFCLNTVRVPTGYWMAGFDKTGGSEQEVYAPGSVKHLDNLIRDWAVKYNIAVLVGMHAAKGSQNGYDHNAPMDIFKQHWSEHPENVQNTVDYAVWIADRYKNDIAFLGIGLLNEPGGSTDRDVLHKYFETAHDAIRATGNDCILTHAPMITEQLPWNDRDTYPAPRFTNMWMEWHKYLKYNYDDYTEDQFIGKAVDDIAQEMRDCSGNPLFIGEWSVATGPQAPFKDDAKFKILLNKMTQALSQNVIKAGYTAWFWKTSSDENGRDPWSLRTLLREGLFSFGDSEQKIE